MNDIPKWRCPRIGEKYYKLRQKIESTIKEIEEASNA